MKITIDKTSSNNVAIDYMSKRIKDREYTILGGDFFHMWCVVHILNLIIMDGLKDISEFVTKIRDAAIYMKSPTSRCLCAIKKNINGG